MHPEEIKRYLSDEQYRLYRLIWQRFVASQMVPAVFDQTTVDIVAKADRGYNFRVTGSVMKFDGFLKVYEEAKEKKDDEDEELKNRLPALENGQALALNALLPEEHFTEPPSALQRGFAGEGAGRARHRTALHICHHHQYDSGAGVRPEGG